MKKKVSNNHSKFFWIISVILTLAAILLIIYLIVNGRHYFTRRGIRQVQRLINSYGTLSPFAVILLIFLSTAIPPLPLPIPLIEIAAGVIFGFWPGVLLVWISQVSSSVFAFTLTRAIGKRIFGKILNNNVVHLYEQYIDRSGPLAVLLVRATMAAPFNIISYLAGLTQMRLLNFSLATAIGAIPESILYVFIGTIFRRTRLSLWYLFILVVLLGTIGPIVTFVIIKFLQPARKKKRTPN